MPKVISLFSGCGGLDLGFKKAGFDIIWANDFEKNAVETYKNNLGSEIVFGDINKIDITTIPKSDLLIGGFPCQPFSYAGKKLGLDDIRGTVFFRLIEILNYTNPTYILLENVKGLLSHDNGKTFETIKFFLKEAGFNITYKVLNAWDYGVAQKRERLFIFGSKKNIDNFGFPLPHSYKPVLKDVLKDVPKSDGYLYPEHKKKVLDLVPQGGCHRDLPDEIAKKYMGKSYYLGGGRTGIARRIAWNEPSLTLTTSPMQKQTERCHPDETRPFTVREYARIQSFPDDFVFYGNKSYQYKQIGNAVPVNLSYNVAKIVLDFISKSSIEEKESAVS